MLSHVKIYIKPCFWSKDLDEFVYLSQKDYLWKYFAAMQSNLWKVKISQLILYLDSLERKSLVPFIDTLVIKIRQMRRKRGHWTSKVGLAVFFFKVHHAMHKQNELGQIYYIAGWCACIRKYCVYATSFKERVLGWFASKAPFLLMSIVKTYLGLSWKFMQHYRARIDPASGSPVFDRNGKMLLS